MRRAIVVFAALLALTLLPARAEADYAHTVLVYMIGADLQESGYAAEDLEEMLDADIGADTCVLLLAGGAPGVHIYTMNNADVAKQVYAGIRTALGREEA